MKTRILKLTHEEIDLIDQALKAMYLNRLALVEAHRDLLGKDVVQQILKDANKFDYLKFNISNSTKDV